MARTTRKTAYGSRIQTTGLPVGIRKEAQKMLNRKIRRTGGEVAPVVRREVDWLVS
jgi:hypothetical protein